MSSATAACPFCNAELPPIQAPSIAARTPCPRCGEPVPNERFPVPQQPGCSEQPGCLSVPAASTAVRTRKTLLIVLSIMAGMASFALVFALLTQKTRRDNDFKYKTDATVKLAQSP